MIISLSGLIGSGKDTVAEMLIDQHGFVQESFASTVKDMLSVVFGWDRTMLEGKTPETRAQREEIDLWWAARLNMPKLSPRWAMQHIGTEVMRGHFHDDIWIAALEQKLEVWKDVEGDVVISDARFINELDMLKRSGAITVCVNRGEKPIWWEKAKLARLNPTYLSVMLNSDVHRSEWDWAGYEFDMQLDNNGSLTDLAKQTSSLIQ